MNKIEGGGDAEKAMRSANCHSMKMYVHSTGRNICRPFAPVPQTKFSRCLTIVSRGDWLGKPANFKGPNNRVPAEVELTRHVTLTVHTTNKMADATNELFVFGDDFETILNMLEEDEAIEKHFSTTAIDVSIFYVNSSAYFGRSDPKCTIRDSLTTT